MFNFKKIKKSAKSFFKKNKWTLIVSGLITTFIVGETTLMSVSFNNLELTYNAFKNLKIANNESISEEEKEVSSTSDVIKQYSSNLVSEILSGNSESFITEYNKKNNVTKGIVFDAFTMVSRSRVQVSQFVEKALNNDENSLSVTLTLCFMAILSLLIKILLTNPLLVGQSRLFLESKNYPKTKLRVLAYAFRKKKYSNAVKTILLRNIRQLLWNITIIGGFIKAYSYKMVKYIEAENGYIPARQAIKMSREMMDGHKVECFKLDVTFWGWNILVILTFGLAGIIITPYYESVMTEYYSRLRKEYIEKKKYCFESLNDYELYENLSNRSTYLDATTKEERRQRMLEEYEEINSKYDWWDYIMFFFIFAIIGWLWEVLYFTLQYGVIVNRGALYGPWLPIYGFGCSLIILIFSKMERLSKLQTNPLRTFLLVMFLCTIMEYLTSFVMEKLTGIRYWEYKGIFLNINGRVCLENSIFFGLGGSLCIYVIGPLLQRGVHRISKNVKIIACVILMSICILDATYSTFKPHTGKYITEENTDRNAQEYVTEKIEKGTSDIILEDTIK